MSDTMTKEELEQFRKVLEDLPESERAKIRAVMKSGRLISLVSLLDAVVVFFERLGALGSWINKVLRPVLTGLAVIVVIYLILTGKVQISELRN